MSTKEPSPASESTDYSRVLNDSGHGNLGHQGAIGHNQMVRREMVAGLLFLVTLRVTFFNGQLTRRKGRSRKWVRFLADASG